MNDKIEVLSVLADYSAQHGDPEDLEQARAAIAELIEKANAVLDKHPGHRALLGHRQAQHELRAALARIGGGK